VAVEGSSGHDISYLALTPDARHFAAIVDSSAIFVWDYNGKLVQGLDLKVDVDNFAVSGHGRSICTGAEDGIVRLWNAETGQQIRRFLGHKNWIGGVAFSPDGRYVLSAGGLGGTCRVWDISTGLEIRRFSRANATGMSNCAICVASSADGQFAVSGYADGTISLWKLDIDHTIW
jgi:WD40 repeat protein